MDDSEFRIGERLSPATRIERFGNIYAKDILGMPVPFENRVAHLSEYTKMHADRMNAEQLSSRLCIPMDRTQRLLREVGAPIVNATTPDEPVYDEYTVGVIQEELEWINEYSQLPAHLSAKSVGRHLGKNTQWVSSLAKDLGIFPKRQLMPSSRYALAYEKKVILPLRHWILYHTPVESMYTVKDLMTVFGRHQDWVHSRLDELGATPLLRTSRTNGILTPHYSREALEGITRIIEDAPQPAGDWLTVGTMAMVLQRDRKWVLIRIRQYSHLAEIRLDDLGREAVHYPPEVFDFLTIEDTPLGEG